MKTKLFLSGIALLSVFLLTSCLQKGYVVFDGKSHEIIPTQTIKDFIRDHPRPSIVLRVPKGGQQITESDQNDIIYNAIEKELVLNDFDVRDRALFNEVVNKAGGVSYNDLKQLTGTDMILELIRFQRDVDHETNTFYTKKDQLKIANEGTINRPGAVIEFKLILLEKNEHGGSYTFYYTPCEKKDLTKCSCLIGYKGRKIYPYLNMCRIGYKKVVAYEYVEENDLEPFVRDGVRKMINEIK